MLLQELSIPQTETHIIPAGREQTHSRALSIATGLIRRHGAAFVRTAWYPDLFAAPWFRCYSPRDFVTHSERLSHARTNATLTHYLLHGEVGNPDDPEDRLRYLSGRLLLHPTSEFPANQTLEIVHGEYFPRLLDTVDCVATPRVARYQMHVAQISWRPQKTSPFVSSDDVVIITRHFRALEERIDLLREVLALESDRPPDEITLCFDFVASRASDRTFYVFDFDYAAPARTS